MNPNTSRSSAMHARWRTRAAICCALVCSAFWVGNVDAEETGNTQANVETIKNQTYAIMQDVDALRSQVEMIVDDVDVLSQLEYWFGTVRTAIESFDTFVRAGIDLRPNTLNVFRDYFDSVESSLTSIRSQLAAVGTVTNFLGYAEGSDLINAFWDVFDERHDDGQGLILVSPWSSDEGMEYISYLRQWLTFVIDSNTGTYYTSPGLLWDIRRTLQSWNMSATGSATTNLLTSQNATLDRVAEYVAGVSNAVGTISNEYETDPTGSNDLPSAETPDDLTVERSVDTSSLEDAVEHTFDGLDNLTPTGSSTVPEIMIRDAYRGEDAIMVRLDLHEIGIATRVCKACWAILLAVGVLGVVRSEWDYWTTLGGSAT